MLEQGRQRERQREGRGRRGTAEGSGFLPAGSLHFLDAFRADLDTALTHLEQS